MPKKTVHIKIDEEVLKPLRIIPKNYDTRFIHQEMDSGTPDYGWFHRVIDKWHEPRYNAILGFHAKKKGVIPKSFRKQANHKYRVAKVHRIVDEYYYRYKSQYGNFPNFKTIKKYLLKKLKEKKLIRSHFNL